MRGKEKPPAGEGLGRLQGIRIRPEAVADVQLGDLAQFVLIEFEIKHLEVSRMRDGVTDFGITIRPLSASAPRSAPGFFVFSASALISGWSNTPSPPCASGLP